jgi:hypothetical protein
MSYPSGPSDELSMSGPHIMCTQNIGNTGNLGQPLQD